MFGVVLGLGWEGVGRGEGRCLKVWKTWLNKPQKPASFLYTPSLFKPASLSLPPHAVYYHPPPPFTNFLPLPPFPLFQILFSQSTFRRKIKISQIVLCQWNTVIDRWNNVISRWNTVIVSWNTVVGR